MGNTALKPKQRLKRCKEAKSPVLNLAKAKLEKIPKALWALPHAATLRVLDLSGNKLKVVPASLGNLVGLKTLQLANNRLTALPAASLPKLKALKVLSLDNNRLDAAAFAAVFGAVSRNVETLCVARNAIQGAVLAGGGGYTPMKKLKVLDLSGNGITAVGAAGLLLAKGYPCLEDLNLDGNLLADLPGEQQGGGGGGGGGGGAAAAGGGGYAGFRRLKCVKLRGNRIVTLPAGLFRDCPQPVVILQRTFLDWGRSDFTAVAWIFIISAYCFAIP